MFLFRAVAWPNTCDVDGLPLYSNALSAAVGDLVKPSKLCTPPERTLERSNVKSFVRKVKCDIVFISQDVKTNKNGTGKLEDIKSLINRTKKFIKKDTILVILSQIQPKFMNNIKFDKTRLFYQVETLVFGRAVERALYPERIIIGCYNKNIPINETHESPLTMLVPLSFLGIGALFAGFLFKETFIGNHSNEFWQTSIFFINEIKHDHIPLWLLVITPILVTIAIPLSFYYYISNTKILEEIKNNTLPLYNFLLNKWYIDELYDSLFIKPTKKIGSFFWKKGDIGTIDRFGPDGISKLIKIISDKAGRLQTGFIYDYAFVMLIGLSILLTYLILN